MATNQFDAYISAAAKKYGVPEEDVRQIISVESSWDPKALSKTGPRGLMQVSGAVAKDAGYTRDDMWDPEKNIDAGVRFYAQSLKHFDGDKKKALLGYNQGIAGADAMLAGRKPMAPEGYKYMNNAKFDPKYLSNRNVPNPGDYLGPRTFAGGTPAQAGASFPEAPNTAALVNMGQAGMNNENSTAGASQFTPAMLNKDNAAETGGTYGAASAPASTDALGTVPEKTEGFNADKWVGVLNAISGIANMNRGQTEQAQARASASWHPVQVQNNPLAADNFQALYQTPTAGNNRAGGYGWGNGWGK